jgi:hypothetical protein
MMVFPEPGVEWLVHVLAGHTNARSAGQELVLETGSSLHIDFRGSDSGRVVLDGAGELMLVKFTRIGER